MPGMNSGLNPADPTIVNAFRSALLHQWLIAAAIFVLLLLVWGTTRAWATVPAAGDESASPATRARAPAERARAPVPRQPRPRPTAGAAAAADRIRRAVGVRRHLAGAARRCRPGCRARSCAPEVATAPSWVKDLINWSGTGWTYHPVQAGAAAVWIQVGIAVWMLARRQRGGGPGQPGWSARGGAWSSGCSARSSVASSARPEPAGGRAGRGPSTSWPGAYRAAHTAWQPRIGAGCCWLGRGRSSAAMAVLQAWPGRGFWQGTVAGKPGPLRRHGRIHGEPPAAIACWRIWRGTSPPSRPVTDSG